MAKESDFVTKLHDLATAILKPPLLVKRGASLLYRVTVDSSLSLTVDPKRPIRGDSAFQTDLCIFEKISTDKSECIDIPRVVIEFKTTITTHDILTYNAKARQHKTVYPYLRYGMIASDLETIPGRFFTHNESLDFFHAVRAIANPDIEKYFSDLLAQEIQTSKKLEEISFSNLKHQSYRTEVHVE